MEKKAVAIECFLTVDYFYGGAFNLNGQPVYMIDGIPTIITAVSGDYAKGFILSNNLTLIPCYIVKEGRYFAHGDTLAAAARGGALEKWQNGQRRYPSVAGRLTP